MRRAALLFAGLLLIGVYTVVRQPGRPAEDGPGEDAAPVDPPTVLPEGAEAFSLLGRPLYPRLPGDTLGEGEASLERARARVQQEPGSPDAHLELARLLVSSDRYREAAEILARAKEPFPDDPRVALERGRALLVLRRLDEAVAELRRASELVEGRGDEPSYVPPGELDAVPGSTLAFDAWYHLGLAHYLDGELEQAALALNEALETAGTAPPRLAVGFWLVGLYERLGLEGRAERTLAALDVPEDGAGSPHAELLLLFRGRRAPEALLGGGEGARVPLDPTLGYGLGLWHFTGGRRERAFELWERVAASDPWDRLGRIAAEAELARVRSP